MMNTERFQRFLPVTGVLFSVLMVVGIAMTANSPSETASATKVFSYWSQDTSTKTIAAVLVIHLAAVLLVFFGAGLRAVLRASEATEASYSSVAFGGAILAAAGFALDAMLTAAAVHAAERGSQTAVYAIAQVSSVDWLVWTAGLSVMLLGAGLGGLRTLAIPRPLSWAAIVLGVAFFTPLGAFAVFLLPVWTLATSIHFIRVQRAPVPRRVLPDPA